MVKRKKKKRVKYKIKNIIMLLLLFSFIGLVLYCVIMMPIDNIYISGNGIVSDDEVMEIADIDSYPSFLLVNRFDIKKKLLNNDYIEDVKIKKRFGNVIEISILEYRVVASNSSGRIILSNGKEIENHYNIYDVPLLVNEISDRKVFEMFVSKMDKLDKNILRQISEVEYSPVEVDDLRFLFYMSDGNVVHITLTKLNKMDKYNKIKDKLLGKKAIIYLDSGNYVELVN